MKDIFIIDALRTPVANFGGALRETDAVALGRLLVETAVERSSIPRDRFDGVIMGNVLQAGLGQNPARQCAIGAGLTAETPAFTLNKVCGSGMKAVDIAFRNILSGCGDLYLTGGMESMSGAPYLLEGARWGYKLGDRQLTDEMVKDGLWCPYNHIHMGSLVDSLAREYGISRKDQDSFSLKSHRKAVAAMEEGRFDDEIVPVEHGSGKKRTVLSRDEHPRSDTTLEKLAALKPAFSRDGTVTAGNASGLNDGAALLLVASRKAVDRLDMSPIARILSISEVGVEPKYFGISPINATCAALAASSLKLSDIDLAEYNEAFAAQSLIVLRKLKIDQSIVNVNGGAIALGHPIGASGARIMVTLIHEMKRREVRYGLASLCIGSGEGMAAVIERI